ncbi:MAG: twin-arginine translocase subunit TatB [Gammaproteobacteria bacterium]|nr:twin-arginine translocase subunit TatB [Gammaproteobacteria bacterium]
MFDMGFAEMLIIGIVALLVIGPERLPSVARKAGAYVAKIKRFVSNVKSDVEREFRTDELQQILKQQQEELSSLKDIVNETRKDADLGSIEKSVRESGEDVISNTDSGSDIEKQDTAKQQEPAAEKINS